MNSGLLSFFFKKQDAEEESGLCSTNDVTTNEALNLRVFTYAELKSATRNFRPDSLLGEGRFGNVYKGWVDEKTLNPVESGLGMVIAVNRLESESFQGLEEWQGSPDLKIPKGVSVFLGAHHHTYHLNMKSGVNFLGRLSHPNIVKLLGYCEENEVLLLVYEFIARGSLETHLFRRGGAPFVPLSWDKRLKIMAGAARALTFLHSCEKPVIYRDFKTSNILLDSDYNAKLSSLDFAMSGPTDGEPYIITHDFDPVDIDFPVSMWFTGTPGYIDPAYKTTGRLYVKSDVYGFGVVLLEMLSGKRALDMKRPRNEQSFVDGATPFLTDRRKLEQIMDPQLERKYPLKGAFQAAQLTLKCLAGVPKDRPSMKEVVEKLEHIEAQKGR